MIKDEYLCSNCGLVWDDKAKLIDNVCPECGSRAVFVTDTTDYFINNKVIINKLSKNNREIHKTDGNLRFINPNGIQK